MSAFEWARTQLDGVEEPVRGEVLALLTVWEGFTFSADDPDKERVLSFFSDLARGVAIEKEDQEASEFVWIPAAKAKPRQKDRVRVRRDAFTGEQGKALNGKEGIVARVSRGTLVIAFGDEGSAHVHPDKLEARVLKQP